jgi:glycerophosphoryl diester phosphodiesterase
MKMFCLTLMAMAIAASTPAAEPARPLVVGHRGLIGHAPENTLAAYRACLALRVGFEFDVRRTKDGQLVCLHDATLDRTTNGRGPLAEMTLAEVRKLDAGAGFDRAFAGERVPTIEEIFTLIAEQGSDHSLIAVDMKDTGDGVEEAVVRLAEKHKVLPRLIFIGATIESEAVRQRLRAANAKTSTARLAPKPEEIDAVIADETCSWVYVRFLPAQDTVQRIHRAGKRIFIAGPLVAGEEEENWTKAAALQFDGILTDHPLQLEKLLRPAKP